MRVLSAKEIAAAFSYATLPKGVTVGDVQATLAAYQAVVVAVRERHAAQKAHVESLSRHSRDEDEDQEVDDAQWAAHERLYAAMVAEEAALSALPEGEQG